MIGIYKIENLVNHKKYIGQSNNIERRWKNERSVAFNEHAHEYDYPLSRAFRKYGLENFSFEVIEECHQENLNEREQYWIAQFDSYFNGYNQTLGGGQSINGGCNKEKILGIFKDLETTDMIHSEIAKRWDISIEMVQGMNTGRYWRRENIEYPIQERCKILKEKRGQGRTKKYCVNCGAEITNKATLCPTCNSLKNRIVARPSREELKQLIRTKPFTTIARQFGVSDNAIRKWCDAYNLPRKVSVIKQISDEDWGKL